MDNSNNTLNSISHAPTPLPRLRHLRNQPPHRKHAPSYLLISLLRLTHPQIPAYVLFILQLLFWTYISERFNQRFLVGLISQIWALPLLIALELLPATASPWSRWVLSTLLVGHPYIHAILVAITSRNAGAVRTRTVASALYNMCVQASSIISQNIYRDDDKPLYRRGNKVLLAICAYNFVLFVGAKVYYVNVNRKRDAVWEGMTREEKEMYLETTEDEGNRRLDFRFAH